MTDTPNYRRLTRSTTEKRLFGVCGGLAQYLNADPTVVRLIVVLLTLCGCFGLLMYLIMALIMPADNTQR